MCRMSFKVSRAPGRGAGGCAFGLPSSARRGRQPVKCSVTFSGLGSYLVFTFFFFFFRRNGGVWGRKERKRQRPSRALGCPGSAAVAADGAGAFHGWHPRKDPWLVLHKRRASVKPYAGFRAARLSAVGFGAGGSLLRTFPSVSAIAGCVIVGRQRLPVLSVSGCGGRWSQAGSFPFLFAIRVAVGTSSIQNRARAVVSKR